MKRLVKAIRTLAEETRASRMMLAWLLPAAILLLANWSLYLWKLLPLVGSPEPVAIHYSVLVGIDKLLPWYWTLLPAVSGTIVLTADWLLAAVIRRHLVPLAATIGIFVVFLEGLFLVNTLLIALLNVAV